MSNIFLDYNSPSNPAPHQIICVYTNTNTNTHSLTSVLIHTRLIQAHLHTDIYLSILKYIYILSIYLSTYLSIYCSCIYLSVFFYLSLYIFINFICLSLCQFIYPFIHLSIYLSIYHIYHQTICTTQPLSICICG